ncbi:MAG: DUF4340 domain-containing protein [Bdellovibrionota bacterium]
MNLTKALLMAIVLVAAGVFLWRSENLSPPSLGPGQSPIKMLEGVSGKDVTDLSVAYDGGAYGVRKTSVGGHDVWMMDQPAEAQADAQKAGGMILSLSRLIAQNTIEADEVGGKLAIFGLEPPQLILTAKGPFGSREFHFGKKVELSGRRYLQRAGDDRVYLVEDGIFTLLHVPADDVRDRTPIDFDPAQVQELSLTRAATDKLILTRDAAGWTLKAPSSQFPADSELVSQKLAWLKNLKAEKFVDEPTNLALYGLDAPRVVASLRFPPKEGGSATDQQSLEISIGELSADAEGGVSPDKKHYYFKTNTKPFVYELGNPGFADLMRGPEFFRPRQPLAFLQPETVTGIEIEEGGMLLAKLNRSSEQPNAPWTMTKGTSTEPVSPETDARIHSLVAAAVNTQVLTYYSPTEGAQLGTGLDHPSQKLKIFVKDKTTPILLVIGNAVQDRESSPQGGSHAEQAHENPRWIAVSQADGSFFPAMVSSVTYEDLSKDLTALGQK